VAWGRRRLDARSPRGFWLTFTVAAGALAALAFGGLTQDVTGHDDVALADPHVTAWVIAHRTGWLTSALQVFTWLGSTVIFSITYLLTRCLLNCLMLLAWRDVSKEAELLVLRHENAVLPADRPGPLSAG
jgi:undecaprenyl-diphosphatase